MNADILAMLTSLIVMPLLVIQSRILMSKRLRSLFAARDLVHILINELPNDLAVIGMTLAFAGYATLIKGQASPPLTKTLIIFVIIPFLPFVLMSAIPISRSRHIRLALGLMAYLIGAITFVLGLFSQHFGITG